MNGKGMVPPWNAEHPLGKNLEPLKTRQTRESGAPNAGPTFHSRRSISGVSWIKQT